MKLGSRLQLIALVAVVVLISACAIDVTKSDTSHQYIDQCFVSIEEAMFVSRECKNGDWTYCDTVVPLFTPPAGTKPFRFRGYPPTLKDYQNDPIGWSASIHELEKHGQPLLAPDHIAVYGGLPLSTLFKVNRILNQFDGENGRYWEVYAVVEDGEFKGRHVLLPRGRHDTFDFDYLARCK